MTNRLVKKLLQTISSPDITLKIFSALEACDMIMKRAIEPSPESPDMHVPSTHSAAFPVDWCVCSDWRLRLPELPARPAEFQIMEAHQVPKRHSPKGTEGAAQLLHALAQIELSAIEIDCAFLYLYPSAPEEWKRDMAAIIRDECRHFTLISQKLVEWQRPFGSFPVHFALWKGFGKGNSWLEHLALATRYQEGNGVDASFHLLQLAETSLPDSRLYRLMPLIKTLHSDEIDHVFIGSKWWNWAFEHGHVSPEQRQRCEDSSERFFSIVEQNISKPWSNRFPFYLEGRVMAGFNKFEMMRFESLNASKMQKSKPKTVLGPPPDVTFGSTQYADS